MDRSKRALSVEGLNALFARGSAVVYAMEPLESFPLVSIGENITKIIGLSADECLATPDFWTQYLHPDDAPGVRVEWRNIFEDGESAHEYRLKHKSGGWRWVRDERMLQRDSAGKPTLVLGKLDDITEHKDTEDRLRALDARFFEILNLSHDAIISVNIEQRIILFNEAAESTFGYRADEMIGKSIDVILPERHRLAHRRYLRDFGNGQAETRRMRSLRGEIVGVRKDGSEFPAEASISKVVALDDPVFVAMVRDVSDRKLSDMALQGALSDARQGDLAKQEFLANMTHEFRTPLNAILGFSSLIEREMFGPLGNKRYNEYIRFISSSGAHLMNLVDSVLNISRIETGDEALQCSLFEVAALIEEAVGEISRDISGKGLAIEVGVADGVTQIRADRMALRQVLLNVLSNAVKFTPTGGKITVFANFEPTGGVGISIADTGIGIAAENIKKVMAPFAQTNDAQHASQGGIGLGLPISRSLVELHGGSIRIESELGAGTTVRIMLPPPSHQDG
ncbi:MAG: PAS domain S-box protein [Rhodospirillaceae bacterium]|jgi:PAS domain S-box-containing protein|nr:PAS domain S-box protein [Rhodospirillaceae bacterium]MBT5664542.1 PAS domain S-box protein [Rhodospirillaceae bacterium]MBT5812040.1 PAS domain S-box protein [Rhodospirillaceae bacterium]